MDFIGWSTVLINNYGYYGIFLAAFINGIGFGLPTPVAPILMSVTTILDPKLIIIMATIASVLGECIAFSVGIGGHHGFLKKIVKKDKLEKIKNKLEGNKFYLPILAIIPLPSSTLGITSGLVKINFVFFLLSTAFGRFIRMSIYVGIGYFGLSYLLGF